MKKYQLLSIVLITGCTIVYSQVKMEVEGAIVLQHSEVPNPAPGTIRWSGSDFEGFNGTDWVSLTGGQTATVTDSDGNTYKTVKIGEQIWMAENLRTRRYRNGELITLTQSDNNWENAVFGAYCWYDNDSNNEIPYGKLYNWLAVNDARGLCPTGWHVPDTSEWSTLIDFLDENNAGGKMKEVAYWDQPNVGATNESGFRGLPAGIRYHEGTFSEFGEVGLWWSITESGSSTAWFIDIPYSSDSVIQLNGDKRYGLSVRCVID